MPEMGRYLNPDRSRSLALNDLGGAFHSFMLRLDNLDTEFAKMLNEAE